MNLKSYIATSLFLLTGVAFAYQQPEEQCKKSVDTAISALETMSQQMGREQKLKDMSANDIRQIQRSKGSCAAMQVINKRIESIE